MFSPSRSAGSWLDLIFSLGHGFWLEDVGWCRLPAWKLEGGQYWLTWFLEWLVDPSRRTGWNVCRKNLGSRLAWR